MTISFDSLTLFLGLPAFILALVIIGVCLFTNQCSAIENITPETDY
jgi:hypothetical protein